MLHKILDLLETIIILKISLLDILNEAISNWNIFTLMYINTSNMQLLWKNIKETLIKTTKKNKFYLVYIYSIYKNLIFILFIILESTS